MSSECRLCATAEAVDEADVVHRGTSFTAATGMKVPGWVLLWSHRHEAQGLWELTDAESAELGILLRDLSAAVRDTVGAERTYVMAMGEHALHFHAMVLARTPDTAPEHRGPGLLAAAPALADAAAARTVAAGLRASMACRASA
ncbi:MAG: hypothetical protein JWO60_2935 [Frankiales bacterium]|nr:hypothetical protein [Frankiales bacterium]